MDPLKSSRDDNAVSTNPSAGGTVDDRRNLREEKHEQNGVGDEEKSVARQIEHAKVYAAKKGWTVDDAHVYSDDGISGAEFKKRPGFLRLLNALSPRPPFQVLVMSEESRLGREAIETGYVLKQIMDAGVRVFFYLEDRERTLDTAMDKVMLSLTNFASEMEREKARQRTYDAMVRKAKALHVTGGKVYGYRNEEVLDAEGRRLHVLRRIDPDEAATVRRIFALYAAGKGMISIAKALNADGVKPPRGHGWAPSAIREMLYRELYRGVIVWNRKQKITRGGTKKLRKRPESEWLRLEAPELQIIPPDLWEAVQTRLSEVRVAFARSQDAGKLLSRPASSDTPAQYLLTGFMTCGVCGSGALVADARMHGRADRKRLVRAYGCSFHRRRGDAVCTNGMSIRQDVLDRAILAAISETLDERVLDAAVDRALARIRQGEHKDLDRRTQIERELSLIASKMERLLDALADGAAPKDEIVARMTAEKSRKTTLVDELAGLERRTTVVSLDPSRLKKDLRARVADVKMLLGRHPQQARQMLRKLLTGKIKMDSIAEAGRRGYRFSGNLSIGRLLSGEALQSGTREILVTGGIRTRVSDPPRAFVATTNR